MYFWDNGVRIGCVNLSLLRREYLSSAVNVLTNTYQALHLTKTWLFPTQLPSKWSLNMVTVLWFRWEQCLNPFTMFPVKGYFKTGLFGHISNHVFRIGVISEINQLWGSSFFWKCSKFNVDFENIRKNSQKIVYFWDNGVRIGCVNLSLLRREYLSSAVNVLTNTYKALNLSKTDFFQVNYLQNDH